MLASKVYDLNIYRQFFNVGKWKLRCELYVITIKVLHEPNANIISISFLCLQKYIKFCNYYRLNI